MANNGIIGNETEQARASLKEKVNELVDAGKERVEDVKGKIGDVKDKIVDVKDRVVDKADNTRMQLVDMIKDHPLAAVGIAFGIGYFAMRIFRR